MGSGYHGPAQAGPRQHSLHPGPPGRAGQGCRREAEPLWAGLLPREMRATPLASQGVVISGLWKGVDLAQALGRERERSREPLLLHPDPNTALAREWLPQASPGYT